MDTCQKYLEGRLFDLNMVADFIVPVYTVAVIGVIITYYNATKGKKEEIYRLKKRENPKDAPKTWQEQFSGLWHQYKADNLDDWLKAHQKNFIQRSAAAQFFITMRHLIKIEGNHIYFRRDFGPGKSEWSIEQDIGTSEESAPEIQKLTSDNEECKFKVWYDEEKKELIWHFTFMPNHPVNKTMTHTRKFDENGQLFMRWDAVLKDGTTPHMYTYYKRIADKD